MSFIGGIVSIAIGAIMLSAVFLSTVHATNTSGWSASEITLWGTLGIVGIVGLVYGTLQVFGIV